jgi:hypothetical protein
MKLPQAQSDGRISRAGRWISAALLAMVFLLPATLAAAQERKPTPSRASQGTRTVVGFTETVRIYPHDLEIRAKIDTGARTSSLHAQDIITFERGGRLWVRFHVTNRDNRTVMFERPVVRNTKIKSLAGPALSRPVIMMGICIANTFRVTEVNLSNRTGFNFQLLVGRRFMRQAIIVDPGRQFTREPNCNVTEESLREMDALPGILAPKEDE